MILNYPGRPNLVTQPLKMELFLAVVIEGDVKTEEVSERWIVAGFKNGGRGPPELE